MPRPEHWLDSSLEQCLAQNRDQLPDATALMIINLTGSIRSLERQINKQSEMLQSLYKRLEQSDHELTTEWLPADVVSLSNDGVLVRDEVA
jgi:alpha-ketoglutarate-dependent taurine dioxygenase